MATINHTAIRTLYVHPGVFHADDVGVYAVLRILNPELEVVRTANLPEEPDANALIADIGGGRYDHHQPNTEIREDGVKHCALTLVWRDFGPAVIEEMTGMPEDSAENAEVCSRINNGLFKAIAMHDNGMETTVAKDIVDATVGNMVGAFAPTWEENSSPAAMNAAFIEAADFFVGVFAREVKRIASAVKAQYLVEKCCQDSDVDETGIVILDRFLPWQKAVCAHEQALFVMYPSLRGGWNVQVVPTAPGAKNSNRIDMPVAWRGLKDAAAWAEQEGMTFCHAGGFLASFATQETALAAAQKLVAGRKEEEAE